MIGEELRERRKAMNLKQDELAELLGVTRITILRWEKGQIPVIPLYIELALKQIEHEQAANQKGS